MRITRGYPTRIGVAAVAVALAAGAGTVRAGNGAAGESAASSSDNAKNIILLIGDGMGVTHINAARARFYGANKKLKMETLPVLGSVSTYAVEPGSSKPEYVTDSASAGTAWASGVKTYNAAIGKDAFGKDVPTILEEAKKAGMRTGNVSTAEITDATPAVLFSHVAARACQGPYSTQGPSTTTCNGDTPIARQIATNNVADVILGGGLSRFEPEDQTSMQSHGYSVLGSFGSGPNPQSIATQRVATKSDLTAVTGRNRRVIGLFNRGNLTVEKFKREIPNTPQAQEPNLAEMTKKAIELLAASDDAEKRGFFLQVEGALIDKRSHANDAAQTLEEMKAFDDAVGEAMAFAAKDKNTLVIVTADHECAGFNIIAKDSFANSEAAAPPLNSDSGNTANNSSPGRTSGNVKDPARSTGPVNGAGVNDPKNFAAATFRTADDPAGVGDGDPRASLWLTYLSGNHTGADVKLFAGGPRSDLFAS